MGLDGATAVRGVGGLMLLALLLVRGVLFASGVLLLLVLVGTFVTLRCRVLLLLLCRCQLLLFR